MKQHFYTRSFHSTTIAFASLFKDMRVKRYNKDGSVRCFLHVPTTLDMKEKIQDIIVAGSPNTNKLDARIHFGSTVLMNPETLEIIYDPSVTGFEELAKLAAALLVAYIYLIVSIKTGGMDE